MSGPRRLIAIGAGLLIVLVALRIAGELSRDDQRAQVPAGSSYAYGPTGVSAFATLLEHSGHQVVRLRDRLADLDLNPRLTVILLWPDAIAAADAAALRRFVRSGGRLVAADEQPRWLGAVVSDPPTWEQSPLGVTRPLAPVPETAGVRSLAAGLSGHFSATGAAAAIVGNRAGALALVQQVGSGRAVLLADAAPLVNSRLARRDDAAFGLALAGHGRPVAFVESVHGYGRATGWGALPGRFRGALVLLAAAGAALVASRGRRLGPAQPEGRALAPARSLYADGLAGALVRTGSPHEAIEPVVDEARRLLATPAGAGADRIRAAALRAGLREEEADAIAAGAFDGAAALAAARGLARINERREER